MLETFGSDMTKFSAGGFVWAAEAKFELVAPLAKIAGTFFRGTIQYGQLPKAGQTGMSVQ